MEKFDLSYNNLYTLTEPCKFLSLKKEIERIVRVRDLEGLTGLSGELVSFVNSKRECFWMLVAVSEWLSYLYNKIESEENEELFSFISDFNFDELVRDRIDFNPEEEFAIRFNSERRNEEFWRTNRDWLWSNRGGEEMTFPELIISNAGLEWYIHDDWGFDFRNEGDVLKYKHWAVSSLWMGLREYCREFPDSEELAICLWTVFDDVMEEMQGSGLNWEVIEMLFGNILNIEMDEWNSDDSDRDDLEPYDNYVHDIKGLSGEVLDRDIFDLSPFRWGVED